MCVTSVTLSPTPVLTLSLGWRESLIVALAVMMFAYDGWGNVTVIAEEMKNPGRNLPRALAGGVVLLIAL